MEAVLRFGPLFPTGISLARFPEKQRTDRMDHSRGRRWSGKVVGDFSYSSTVGFRVGKVDVTPCNERGITYG